MKRGAVQNPRCRSARGFALPPPPARSRAKGTTAALIVDAPRAPPENKKRCRPRIESECPGTFSPAHAPYPLPRWIPREPDVVPAAQVRSRPFERNVHFVRTRRQHPRRRPRHAVLFLDQRPPPEKLRCGHNGSAHVPSGPDDDVGLRSPNKKHRLHERATATSAGREASPRRASS